jgi:hypothetical protein
VSKLLEAHPVEVRTLPLGESGLLGKKRLTEGLVERLAHVWAKSTSARAAMVGLKGDEVAWMAEKMGVTRAFIRQAYRNRRVLASIRERVVAEAVHRAPDVLDVLTEIYSDRSNKPSERLLAAKLHLTMAEVLRPESITFNANVAVGVQVNHGSDPTLDEDRRVLSELKEIEDSGSIRKLLIAHTA